MVLPGLWDLDTGAELRRFEGHEGEHTAESILETSVDIITYEVRVEDPRTYARPFTITLPITAASGIGVLPYKCHEGITRWPTC